MQLNFGNVSSTRQYGLGGRGFGEGRVEQASETGSRQNAQQYTGWLIFGN